MIGDERKMLEVVKYVSCPTVEQRRQRLQELEDFLLQFEQTEIPVKHRFCGGIYTREITIPKGCLVTGRIHKFDHMDYMISGDITLSTDTGEVKRLSGYNVIESKAGKKRAAYTHEETVWVTLHAAEERNAEDMYEVLTCATFEEFEHFHHLLSIEMEKLSCQQ